MKNKKKVKSPSDRRSIINETIINLKLQASKEKRFIKLKEK